MGGAFMKNIHRLIYNVETANLEKTILLAFELTEVTGMEPAALVLPDGREIPWNSQAAHDFAENGVLSEEEFIQLSLADEKKSGNIQK